jgi:hypothetical protein
MKRNARPVGRFNYTGTPEQSAACEEKVAAILSGDLDEGTVDVEGAVALENDAVRSDGEQ